MEQAVNPPPPFPPTQREKAKRGARACTLCRRLKKTCEGGSAPCARCKASGTECIFDKPVNSVTEDVGLSRLASIEASLNTHERRMDTMLEQVGQLSSVLTEVLTCLKTLSTSGSQQAQSPAAFAFPSPHTAPGTSLADPSFDSSLPTSSSTFGPSFGRSSSRTSLSTASPLSSLPTIPTLSTLPPSIPSPHLPASNSSASAHVNFPSGLDALASLASSSSPDVARFASRMGQPISALADAVAQLNDQDETLERHEQDVKPEVSATIDDGERPTKRSRVAIPIAAPSLPEQFDLVAKGLIGEKEARALVFLWLKELQPFCSLLDPSYDTYESLRRRSPFLFNVVVYTALRTSERNATPSKELLSAAEETRRFASQQVFENNPSLEVVQALLIMSCYHQEPYILSGMALRLALSARMETTFEQLAAHGWLKQDEKGRRLTAQLRAFIYLVFLDFKHSRYAGRMILFSLHDLDTLNSKVDRALSLPFVLPTDYRAVANLRLIWVERQIMEDTAKMSIADPGLVQQCAYVEEKRLVLRDWYEHYDGLLATLEPSPLSWPRRSLFRLYNDAHLSLACTTFKHRLLDPSSSPPAVQNIAQETLRFAHEAVRAVINSPVYCSGAQWSGYLLRVDLSFAAIFLLKSAAIFVDLVNRDQIATDVENLAALLTSISGSMRYSTMLRAAREQYLLRTLPAAEDPSSASTLTPAPDAAPSSSSSLRAILATPLPTTLVPPFQPFATSTAATSASLAGFSDGATSTPLGALGASSAPTTAVFSTAPTAVGGPGGGTAALLPGEMGIDWNIAVPPSLFDSSDILLTTDWTANLPNNWLDLEF
ncbi:hypothetical protein JCM21900_006116 [Sporobolomyces salmonicolor]